MLDHMHTGQELIQKKSEHVFITKTLHQIMYSNQNSINQNHVVLVINKHIGTDNIKF